VNDVESDSDYLMWYEPYWNDTFEMTTNSVHEALLSEGNILHEDHCQVLTRLGELIFCKTVYDLGCFDPPLEEDDDAPDDWKYSICMKHQVQKI